MYVLASCRFYSTNSNDNNIKPVAIYYNCGLEKARILKENREKAAVYRLVNNINHKTYIHNALLKHGFDNFTLEILEYCEEGINPTTREQYYFSILKPEYNILELAGSTLGYKHTAATLEFFKNERKVSEETKKNLSLAAIGRVLTEEDKNKISVARKGITLSVETRSKISAAAVAARGISLLVKNVQTNENLEFSSLTEAAKHIGVSRPAVKKYTDTGKLIQGIYLVTTK